MVRDIEIVQLRFPLQRIQLDFSSRSFINFHHNFRGCDQKEKGQNEAEKLLEEYLQNKEL